MGWGTGVGETPRQREASEAQLTRTLGPCALHQSFSTGVQWIQELAGSFLICLFILSFNLKKKKILLATMKMLLFAVKIPTWKSESWLLWLIFLREIPG